MNLPQDKNDVLANSVSESYIINKPKSGDIGGDGYWIHRSEDVLFIAIFDCTGSGHLAKMTTRIYINALQKVVANVGIDYTGSILQYIHREVQSKFAQKSEKQLSTGADIAILKLDLKLDKLEYAGAMIDLVKICDGKHELIKGDRIQVGEMFEFPHVYNSNSLDSKSNSKSTYYLSTDGFRNQLSERENRKIGKADFLDLLAEKSKLPMEEQPRSISKYFNKWKGENEQSDDILLIGFKI